MFAVSVDSYHGAQTAFRVLSWFKTDNRAVGTRMHRYGHPRPGLRERRNIWGYFVNALASRYHGGGGLSIRCDIFSLATISALEGLASEHGTHEKWNPRWTAGESVRGMEVHEDTHARLPLHHSDVTVNGRNTPMVGVSTVVEGNTLDNVRNVVWRLVGEVLRGG